MDRRPFKFRYVFDVPATAGAAIAGQPWEGIDAPGEYLLGPSVTIAWTEHTPAPWKLYARVTLSATGPKAAASGVAFTVERGLMKVLRPGDQIFICEVASLMGISILRENSLIAAAGACRALTEIPLGDDVFVRFPASRNEAEIRVPPGGVFRIGPRFDYPEHPTEISAGGESIIWYMGHPTLGPYDVLLRSGSQDAQAWLSIERKKVCPETAAHTSAELLEQEPLEIV